MDFHLTEAQRELRVHIREQLKPFGDEYWRALGRRHGYPDEFLKALTDAGWIGMQIPEEYGGSGLGLVETSIVLEEINRAGGNSTTVHAQMYMMGALLRHANDEQRRYYLPKLANGELRLQAFGVTEPNAGSETTRIETRAVRKGDHYVVNGQKIFTSRMQHSDLMLLLARTTPYDDLKDKTKGLSLFIVDLRTAGKSIEVQPLEMMFNHETNQVFISDLVVPAENLVGEEGMGFRHIIDGWNAERVLLAANAIGDGYYFTDKASKYATDRVVFGKPLAANQGVQFPIAEAYAEVRAADLMRYNAAWLFDSGLPCGPEANMAKLLAANASWKAANACINAHGGYGFAVDYDVERKFRETRLFITAPVNNNLVLAYIGHNVLKMPRSY